MTQPARKYCQPTMSQIGLAERFHVSAAKVRHEGDYVSGVAWDRGGGDGCDLGWWHETWVRVDYSTGRLAGYQRITRRPIPSPDAVAAPCKPRGAKQ